MQQRQQKQRSRFLQAAAIYRQQKVLSHFPVCCWIDWLLMIKNCLIESGPPCRIEYYGPPRIATGTALLHILYIHHRSECCQRQLWSKTLWGPVFCLALRRNRAKGILTLALGGDRWSAWPLEKHLSSILVFRRLLGGTKTWRVGETTISASFGNWNSGPISVGLSWLTEHQLRYASPWPCVSLTLGPTSQA
jgi:hypothetical protein